MRVSTVHPISSFQPALHSLRGLSALAVFFFHWEQFFPHACAWIQQFVAADTLLDPTVYIGFGWMGVPLFFILSGWLLGGQVLSNKNSTRFAVRFWLRRLLRIYPAVWAELLILACLGVVIDGLISSANRETMHLQFLLWINLPPQMAQPLNLVWWTLPVELSFYLLLPLVGRLASLGDWKILLAVACLVTFGWRWWIFSSHDVTNYLDLLPVMDSLPGVLFTFALGFSLNYLPVNLSPVIRVLGFYIGISALLILMSWQLALNEVYWTGHWILVVWTPLVAICIAMLVYSLRSPMPGFRWLEGSAPVWLGHVSFGIYLWHFQVMRIMVLLSPDIWNSPISSVLALFIALPVTLVLAAGSFYFVERPVIEAGRRWLSSARQERMEASS